MKRRSRTTLLAAGAALALVSTLGVSAGPSYASLPSSGVVATSRPTPKPLLHPTSTPYRHTGRSAIALTFDDGPDPTWTPQVLALLRKYHVKATFCLIGVNVKAHPDLVRKIAADGHTLCNHTMRHDLHLKSKSRSAIDADLRATSRLITRASGGVRPTYFRAPGGNWAGVIVSVARKQGMASLGWTVDPRDWAKPPSSSIVARVRAGEAPGVIVLMHDGGGDRSRTVAACKVLLPELTAKYRLTRL
ncbi:polysaccharide deacetylase family protein [Cryptosporangium arvum]|uniref:polysaccharide deacetylase family protein n=1 Tax=Cryptosporangium arvum TaxID=80871 RepID=UPI0004BA432A|nr:polysaccharide deacetylase family protein [Cryptosporangium arvum]